MVSAKSDVRSKSGQTSAIFHQPSAILMGGVLLKDERMRGDEEKCLSDMSGFSPGEFVKPGVWCENKNIHLEILFNQKQRDADGSVAPGRLSD